MSTPNSGARASASDATAMSRALAVIDALPPEFRPADAMPLREALPGVWPTIGDLRAALQERTAAPHSGGVLSGAVDVGVSGPINGMGEPDTSGPYLKLTLSKGERRQDVRISIGAAECLMVELDGLFAPLSAALAPPAVVPESVRRILADIIQQKWDALIGPAHDGGSIGWKRRDLCLEFAGAIAAALGQATPKGTIPPAAYAYAVETWGDVWVENEIGSLHEFAALSTPSGRADTPPAGGGALASEATTTPWPTNCLKPSSCARNRICMYARAREPCPYHGQDLTEAVARAEVLATQDAGEDHA